MQFNWNINIAQIVTVIVAVLALFKIVIPPDIATTVVAVVSGGIAVITWILHTYVNPAKNAAALKARMTMAGIPQHQIASALTKILLVCLMVGPLLFLQGCATATQPSPSNVDNVAKAAVVLTAAQSTYIADCVQPTPQPFCAGANIVQVKAASAAATALLHTAATAAELNTTDVTTMGKLLSQLVADITQFQQIVNSLEAKSLKRKIDPMVIVQIAEAVIQVGLQVYAEITALESHGGATPAQLDSLVASADAANSAIQAQH